MKATVFFGALLASALTLSSAEATTNHMMKPAAKKAPAKKAATKKAATEKK
jgi:hypothetical protein